MKRMMGTGMFCSVAFAALGLAAERNADACQDPDPDPNPCAEMTESATTKLLAYSVVTRPTTGSNCGCSGAISLPKGATLLGQGFFNQFGQAATSFCGSGVNEQTAAAFQNVFGGNWGAGLSALSTFGVIGGQRGISVYRYDNPTSEQPGEIALAQINFDENGNPVVDDNHQVVTAIPATCTNCDDEANATSAKCIALANAAAQLGSPTFAVQKTACAKTDAVALLGLVPEDVPEEEQQQQGGGCNVSGRGAPVAPLLLGMLGVGLGFLRRRSRR